MEELRADLEARLGGRIDRLHARIGAEQRELLRQVAEYDRRQLWKNDGCRDMGQWLSGRLGITQWAGRRWVAAAHALEHLPLTAEALQTGVLCLDKVLELTRFAASETEEKLINWARRVSAAAIRHKADLAERADLEEAQAAERDRSLRWWWFEGGTRLGLEGEFPAAQGTAIVRAIKRLARSIPTSPEERKSPVPQLGPQFRLERRYADALHALAMQGIADDADVDRATIVVHTSLGSDRPHHASEIEDGPVLHPEIARRLSCDSRLEFVLQDAEGNALGIGRRSRSVPPWLMRQLRFRDLGCTFPGCGTRAFLQGHHVHHWEDGGPTDLDNLVLTCHWHHKLVHEFRWKVRLKGSMAYWFRPDGRLYDPGRAPPQLAALSTEPGERLPSRAHPALIA